MIDNGQTRAIELRGENLLGQRHAHSIGEALSQRAGSGFNAHGHVMLGMAGCAAAELTEVTQLVHGHWIASEMQQRIQQHRGMTIGQNEAVTIPPVRVGGVVLEELAPQHRPHFGHAHGRAGMPGVGLLDGIHGQNADYVGQFAAVGRRGRHRRARGSEGRALSPTAAERAI